MRSGLLTMLLCLASAAPSCAHAAAYAYAWPLHTEGDSAAWQIELTPEVCAVMVTQDLRDLDVINADDAAVPIERYVPPHQLAERERAVNLEIFTLPVDANEAAQPVADDAIQLHIERGADGRLRRLDVDTAATRAPAAATAGELLLDASYVHEPIAYLHIDWGSSVEASARFSISASDDLQHWRTLSSEEAVLRLRQNGSELNRHDIPLGGVHANYLRLRRLDHGAPLPSLAVSARLVPPSTPLVPARQWLDATFDRIEQSAGNAPGVVRYRYHLPAALPAAGMRLALSDDNAVVAVSVTSTPDGDAPAARWTSRGDGVLFRLHQGETTVSNDQMITFAGERARDWRVEMSTPQPHPPTLSIAYEPDRFVFLAQGPGPYRLVAGSATARRSDYPVQTALASLRVTLGEQWQPPLAALGTRESMQGLQALTKVAAESTRDWRGWMLWAVLVGAAALIAGLALSLLRKPG